MSGAPSLVAAHQRTASFDGDPEPPAFLKPWKWRAPETLPAREWLYGHHYIRRFVSATFAPGGLGKSAMELADALAMATGKPLIGIQPTGRFRVGYWNGEDPLDETERRVAAAMIHHGLTKQDLDGWLFWGSGRESELVIAQQDRAGVTVLQPNVDRVVRAAKAAKLDALIIDPFVSCHRVTENDNLAIDRVAKTWGVIAERTNMAIGLVHHTRKNGGAETTAEDGRGASSLLAAARSARVLNAMTKEEAERFGVENARSHFRVDNGKANLAPASERTAWFRFISVELGNAPVGPGDSVGVVTTWTAPNAFDGVTATDLIRVQQKIAGAEWRDDIRSPEWAGLAVIEVLGLDKASKGDRTRAKTLLARWLESGALRTETRPDAHRKPKGFIVVGEWSGP